MEWYLKLFLPHHVHVLKEMCGAWGWSTQRWLCTAVAMPDGWRSIPVSAGSIMVLLRVEPRPSTAASSPLPGGVHFPCVQGRLLCGPGPVALAISLVTCSWAPLAAGGALTASRGALDSWLFQVSPRARGRAFYEPCFVVTGCTQSGNDVCG